MQNTFYVQFRAWGMGDQSARANAPKLDPKALLVLSREQVETCAVLTGCDAITPKLASVRFGVSRWAIYKRRRRAEAALGIKFDRGFGGRRRRQNLTSAAA